MSDQEAEIRRLKKAIATLTEQQNEVRQKATYLGMTPDESEDYDSRRDKILKLAKRLARIEEAELSRRHGIGKEPLGH